MVLREHYLPAAQSAQNGHHKENTHFANFYGPWESVSQNKNVERFFNWQSLPRPQATAGAIMFAYLKPFLNIKRGLDESTSKPNSWAVESRNCWKSGQLVASAKLLHYETLPANEKQFSDFGRDFKSFSEVSHVTDLKHWAYFLSGFCFLEKQVFPICWCWFPVFNSVNW